jgi:hypothetical protein
MSQLHNKGNYKANIILENCGTSLSRDNSSEFVYIGIMLTHMQADDGVWIPIEPDEARLMLNTGDKAWPYTKQKLEALGFDGNFQTPNFTTLEEIEVVNNPRESKGTMYDGFDLSGWGEFEPKPIDMMRAKQLSTRWKSETKPTGKPATKAAPPVKKTAAPLLKTSAQPPKTSVPTPKRSATMEEAWAAFEKANADISKPYDADTLANLWTTTFSDKFPGREPNTLTPEEWGEIADYAVNAVVPW